MEIGSFASGLVTGLREGTEAALVVSIVLAYLVRTGHGSEAGRVWLGVTAALVASATVGLALFATVGEFRAPYEQLFEAGTMLAAAAVVTWMLFWMRRQAANVAGELRAAVDRAVSDGRAWTLAALAFVAVIREGVETALFLVGQASAATAAAPDGSGGGAVGVLLGALVGLAIAAALGIGFYHGSRRIDLARFFRWTGVALILIAAGLVASAVHELIEIGVIRVGTGIVVDLGGLLPSSEDGGNVLGMLLAAVFGYRAAPEAIALVAWAAYLAVTLVAYLRPVRRPAAAAAPPARPAAPSSQPAAAPALVEVGAAPVAGSRASRGAEPGGPARG